MNYHGLEIKEIEDVLVTEDYKCLGSNEFDLFDEDLEEMLEDYRKKEAELKESGIMFPRLRFNFYANESCDSDYYPCDADCVISFQYYRPETPEESAKRIKGEKTAWDKKLEDQEQARVYARAKEICEINKAKEFLEQNGYKVSLK